MKLLSHEYQNKDTRRTLTQLLTADVKQINLYDVSKNAVLGNHFHLLTTEYFLILQGSFRVSVGNKSFAVRKNQFFAVLPPLRHSLKCLSQSGHFLTFLTKAYQKEKPDIYV